MRTVSPVLSQQYAHALLAAFTAHQTQRRYGSEIPYLSHPLAVSSLLMQWGQDENVVIAGLLHDAVEDTEMTFEEIEKQFGQIVASLVWRCTNPEKRPQSNSDENPYTDDDRWRMVKLADTLHNARCCRDALCNKTGITVTDQFLATQARKHHDRATVQQMFQGCPRYIVNEVVEIAQTILNACVHA